MSSAEKKRVPLTRRQLELDGAPIRVADLAAISGYSTRTIVREMKRGRLPYQDGIFPNSPKTIDRVDARVWLANLKNRRVGVHDVV